MNDTIGVGSVPEILAQLVRATGILPAVRRALRGFG
jgi:hypothetical protein